MNPTVKKCKAIYFLSIDGTYWIAIKPICEALEVDYETQRKNFKTDLFWSQLPSIQTVVAADNKARKMLCLSERYIYGWIANIRTGQPNPLLTQYKLQCCDILYKHFHGSITERLKALTENDRELSRIAELEETLLDNPDFRELRSRRSSMKKRFKLLKELDQNLIDGQLNRITLCDDVLKPRPHATHIPVYCRQKESSTVDTELHLSKNLDPKVYFDKNGNHKKPAISPVTDCFIQGLIANLHYAHQEGFWDSADHLHYIMQELERGFIRVVKITPSEPY